MKAVKNKLPKKSPAVGTAAAAADALAKLSEQTPQSSRELLAHVSPSMEQLGQFVTGGAEGEMNLSRNRWRKRTANEILLDDKQGHDPERLVHALVLLLDAEAWARENGYVDDANAALWGLYLCHVRTGATTEAISDLQAIWHSLEGIRANIADPFKRAGVFSEFPRLFGLLCRRLCETGRFAEMLAAAEAAKGRVIEDVLSTNGADYLVSSLNIADRTRQVLARLDAHYVSFVVDTDASYAVLVTRRGEVHGHAIPMSRAALRKYARWTDPRCWGTRPDGFKGEQVPKDVYARLAPFVEWLAPYFADGTIQHDDHICYAPHDELFFVPLHALPVGGRLLIDYCSVSRLHHASGLERLAARKATRPKRYCGVFCTGGPGSVGSEEARRSAASDRVARFAQQGPATRREIGGRGEDRAGTSHCACAPLCSAWCFPGRQVAESIPEIWHPPSAQGRSTSPPRLFGHATAVTRQGDEPGCER